MAKKIYIGVSDKARQVKKLYVGVDGKARKVKKGYVGVGGVARPIFGDNKPTAYGTVTALQKPGSLHAVGRTGDSYALFTGGYNPGTTTDSRSVTAYDTSLTVSYPTSIGSRPIPPVGGSVGNYALISGGSTSSSSKKVQTTVYTFDTSLTQSTATALATGKIDHASANAGNLLLFGPGTTYDTDDSSEYCAASVEVYDSSLTKSLATGAGWNTSKYAGTSTGDYAVFAGGRLYSSEYTAYSTVKAINSSLTSSTPTALTTARSELAAATAGDYALFAGGYYRQSSSASTSANYYTEVTAYDSSLTKIAAPNMSIGRSQLAGVSLGDYALFGGGYTSGSPHYTAVVDMYDSSLTLTTLPSGLSEARYDPRAISIGNYALFGGGRTGTSATAVTTVDAFTIV